MGLRGDLQVVCCRSSPEAVFNQWLAPSDTFNPLRFNMLQTNPPDILSDLFPSDGHVHDELGANCDTFIYPFVFRKDHVLCIIS